MRRTVLKAWVLLNVATAHIAFAVVPESNSPALKYENENSDRVKEKAPEFSEENFRLNQFAIYQYKNLFKSFQLKAVEKFLSETPDTDSFPSSVE